MNNEIIKGDDVISYYIYRFKNELDEIIYIGKTININKRIKKHFSYGHLPYECYDSVVKIEYMRCKHEAEMNIKEIYYINKYKPKYNDLDVYNEDRYIINELENDIWNYTYKQLKNRNKRKEKIIRTININEVKYINNYTQIPPIVKNFLNENTSKCFIYSNNDKKDDLKKRILNHNIDMNRIIVTNDVKKVQSIDKDYKIIILNVSNEYLINKYKSIIPHDVDLLVIRTKEKNTPIIEIKIEDEYLNKWILKDKVSELIKSYGINNSSGILIGIREFKRILLESGYDAKSKRIHSDGARYTYYFITHK